MKVVLCIKASSKAYRRYALSSNTTLRVLANPEHITSPKTKMTIILERRQIVLTRSNNNPFPPTKRSSDVVYNEMRMP